MTRRNTWTWRVRPEYTPGPLAGLSPPERYDTDFGYEYIRHHLPPEVMVTLVGYARESGRAVITLATNVSEQSEFTPADSKEILRRQIVELEKRCALAVDFRLIGDDLPFPVMR